MRVLTVQHSGWGGVYHYAHKLSETLVERGHDVRFLTARIAEFGPDRVKYQLLRVFNTWKTSPLELVRALRAKPRPEVVHFHLATHAELYWILQRCVTLVQGSLSVLTLHEIVAKDFEKWKTPLHRINCRLSDRVLVHGERNVDKTVQTLGIPREKIVMIPSFGHYGFFGSTCLHKLPRTPYPSLLFFGFIEPHKGVHDLIHAFAQVLEKEPACRLTIAGKPLMNMEPIYRLCERYGIRDKISFDLRYLPSAEASRLFQQSWLTVLPYTKLTQSAVLFLAFGHECPVVSTDTGAISEVLESGVHGELVPPGDPVRLAGAILDLIASPEKLTLFRGNIRSDCERFFTWENICQQVEGVYLALQSERKSRESERV